MQSGWSLHLTGLCSSTDKGTVQKVIVLPRDDLQTEELVLEEVEVFKVGSAIFSTIFSSYFKPCLTQFEL